MFGILRRAASAPECDPELVGSADGDRTVVRVEGATGAHITGGGVIGGGADVGISFKNATGAVGPLRIVGPRTGIRLADSIVDVADVDIF